MQVGEEIYFKLKKNKIIYDIILTTMSCIKHSRSRKNKNRCKEDQNDNQSNQREHFSTRSTLNQQQ